ncbi:hypothetical protein DYB34_014108, partial [Aphanomyces astaci]
MAFRTTTSRLAAAVLSSSRSHAFRQTARLTTASLPSIARSTLGRSFGPSIHKKSLSPAAQFVRAYSQTAVVRGLDKPKTSLLLETNDGP